MCSLVYISQQQLNVIHTQYHQLKVRLAGPDANRPDRSLDILQDKFPASIMEYVQCCHLLVYCVCLIVA